MTHIVSKSVRYRISVDCGRPSGCLLRGQGGVDFQNHELVRSPSVILIDMSFVVIKTAFGPHTKILVRHEETGNEISIIPEMGARLNHFQVNLHGDSLDIIDGYTDAHALTANVSSKNALLAPFPNRIADGRYQCNGSEYQLAITEPTLHNAIHGFVYNQSFIIDSHGQTEDFYELTFQSVVAAVEGFPFPFTMVVKYRFGGVWLEVETELVNSGTRSMPAGFGWRPYFRTSGGIGHLRLTLPAVEQLIIDDRLLPTGEKVPYDIFSAAHHIGDTVFDTPFLMIGKEREIQLFDEELGLYITMVMPQIDAPYEYVQLYTSPDCNSIAIEPMTCAPNAFNNKMGLKILAPKESLRSHFTIFVS